jgi:hypothetical protein
LEAEQKRERGPGRGVEQRGGVSSARCRAIVEDGGVGATRSTRLTRGSGCDGGPIVSGWVWRSEAVGAALTGGVGSTVRPIRFSNRIKRIQICPKL